jgi:signal peptidase I
VTGARPGATASLVSKQIAAGLPGSLLARRPWIAQSGMNDDLNLFSEEPESAPPRRGLVRRVARLGREILETILPAILIAILINVFIGQATRVDGQSMEPNLHTDQRLVVEKVSYRLHGPQRFDVVVLRLPSQGEELLIKRLVGLPGEVVEIHDGHLYVDGEVLYEPHITQETRPGRQASITVPPLHVYVLGDNRSRSNDSRSFGPVPIDDIVGRAWMSYWPPEDVGLVE